MGRKPLSAADREHGRRLGRLIAAVRIERQQSASDLARESRVALDTVRSLENGRVAMPAFLTVARLAGALGLSLDELNARAAGGGSPGRRRAR